MDFWTIISEIYDLYYHFHFDIADDKAVELITDCHKKGFISDFERIVLNDIVFALYIRDRVDFENDILNINS